MPHTIAVAALKGGSGRTLITTNVAAGLSELQQHVLVIDLDPTSRSTELLETASSGYSRDPARTIAALFGGRQTRLVDLIQKTKLANVDLVPSTPELAGIDLGPDAKRVADSVLLESISTLTRYDVVLVDCWTNLGPLTKNAVKAADTVLIPVNDFSSVPTSLTQHLEALRALEPRHVRIVANMVDPSTPQSLSVLTWLEQHHAERLMKTRIARHPGVDEDPSAIAFSCHPRSELADDFRRLAAELMTPGLLAHPPGL